MLWIACTAVVIAAGFYTLRPLFRGAEGNLDIDLLAETDLDRLLDRKAVIDGNRRDLEFEYGMGRLSDADFQQLAAGYRSESAIVSERLNQLDVSENLDETIEKEITARKSRLSPKPSKARKERDRELPRCPSCGAELIPGKKYCADCGHQV
jgi:hypothetical protein